MGNAAVFASVAKRPPVEETASFLQSLLASHGPNYLEKLFGSKARDALEPLGGVEKVAIALSGTLTSRKLAGRRGDDVPHTNYYMIQTRVQVSDNLSLQERYSYKVVILSDLQLGFDCHRMHQNCLLVV